MRNRRKRRGFGRAEMSKLLPVEGHELAKQFAEYGYCFPVDVIGSADALSHRNKLEFLEQR